MSEGLSGMLSGKVGKDVGLQRRTMMGVKDRSEELTEGVKLYGVIYRESGSRYR